MISGSFQISTISPFTNNSLLSEMQEKKLMLATNVKLTIGDRTLSIAVDNSCGAGRDKAIRSSISLEHPHIDDHIVDNPDEEVMIDVLGWLATGTLSERLCKLLND